MSVFLLTINNLSKFSPKAGMQGKLFSPKRVSELLERTDVTEFYIAPKGKSIDFFACTVTPEKTAEEFLKIYSEISSIAYSELEAESEDRNETEAISYFLKKMIGLQESEIAVRDLQEFRENYAYAREQKWVGPQLNKLYQRGVWLAEKVRIDLNLNKNAVTRESVFLDLAKKIFGDLKKHTALVVSNNADCEKYIRKLKERGVGEIHFLSSLKAAKGISARYSAQKIEQDGLLDSLSKADILLVFDTPLNGFFHETGFWDVLQKRRNAPLLWLELLESGEHKKSAIDFSKFHNVYNYSREDLESIVLENLKEHKKIKGVVDSLIAQEVESFYEWVHSKEQYRFGDIIGKSEPMQKIMEMVARIAQTDISILIDGESGTGKELIAKSIHQHSLRVQEPFIVVNCGAIPETLLESELFGHVKGAFTGAAQNKKGLFEAANKGTIFLDEIGEMSLAMQVKLLRFLQEGEVKPVGSNETLDLDVRVITATNRNLGEMVDEDSFRQDLFYRLNVIQITIPPLRSRQDDILPLVEFFQKKYSDLNHKTVHGLDEKAKELIMKYSWPGNIRELENAVERAIALTPGTVIGPEDLPPSVTNLQPINNFPLQALNMTLKDLEKQHIAALLTEHDWNYDLVTKILGIGRTTLWRKMKEYEIAN